MVTTHKQVFRGLIDEEFLGKLHEIVGVWDGAARLGVLVRLHTGNTEVGLLLGQILKLQRNVLTNYDRF